MAKRPAVMPKILAVFLFVLLCGPVDAQQKGFVLKGRVFDSKTKAPVANASIYINESMTGTTTGADGTYELKIPQTPAILIFSCVGYTRRYFTFTQAQTAAFDVPLDPSQYEIPEVLVTAKRTPVSISDRQDIYVTDYDFYDNQIILLGHPGKRSTRTLLVMMDRMGKRILKKEISQGVNLYRDPFNNLHLLTTDTAYQLYFDGKDLQLLYPTDKTEFKNAFPEFMEIYQGKIILRQYAFDDQALMYYFYQPSDSTIQKFWAQATNEVYRQVDGLMSSIRLTPDGKSTSRFDLFNSDERFVKMAFYSPIFCPLEIIRDTIYIFNFTNGVIETYGSRGFPLETPTAISFQRDREWQKKLYNDRVTGKVYTQFIHNGITELREINLKHGSLKDGVIRIPDFPFISKLMVNDGYLYFLYQEKNYPRFMRLYRMVI
jgi:hypothetical protein